MANNTNATNCTIRSVLYLTIELDDRKDILTIEKKIMCQIFRSSQKPQGKPVRRSTQKTDDLAKRPRVTARVSIRYINIQKKKILEDRGGLEEHRGSK